MTAEEYFEEGGKCYEEGRYEEALECFDKAIRLDENYALPWQGKGNVYYELIDYEQALRCYCEANRLDENYADPWNSKGNVFYELKDYEQALLCYDKAIQLDENYAYPWHGKGNVYHKINNYEQALLCYDEAIRLDEDFARSWNGKGIVYRDINDYEKALLCYDEAILRDANFASPWSGKGHVFDELKIYEQALLCYDNAIQLDQGNATYWNSKGNVYDELKSYEQALLCYCEAIRLDENYAYAWHGKGTVYFELIDYEQALYCYEKAIWLDENFAGPWNGKGIIYAELKDYAISKISFTRALFLEYGRTFFRNNLRLFSVYPSAPFFTYRLIAAFLPVDEYKKWSLLIRTTAEQCQTIQAYIAWLQFSVKQDKLTSSEWKLWLAQVYYFMGDPVRSYEMLKEEVLKENPNELCAWYYFIKSCQGFAEPIDPFMKEAIVVAEQYPLKQTDTAWGTNKQVFSAEQIRQHYFAGLLQYEDEEPELAMLCFRAIKDDFLPAAYMLLYLRHQAGNDVTLLVKDIYRRERRMPDGEMSYARGFYPQHLDLDREDFLAPFQHYSHYWEIADAIDLFASLAPKGDGFVPIQSSEAKAFWSAWVLEEADYQRIFKKAREYHLEIVTDEIIHDRSLVYDFMSGIVADAKAPSEKVVQASANNIGDLLERTYRELFAESRAEGRERRLGNLITEWPFNKPEYYQKLSTALFLQDLLTEKQKVHLDFYAHIQYYVRQKPSDVLFAGAKDLFKEVIDKAITPLMASAGGWPGAALSIFLKPLAKGMLAELIIKHLKSGETPFKTYTDFKEGFKVFIGEEKQRLGDKFEERYPMYGFEDWVG